MCSTTLACRIENSVRSTVSRQKTHRAASTQASPADSEAVELKLDDSVQRDAKTAFGGKVDLASEIRQLCLRHGSASRNDRSIHDPTIGELALKASAKSEDGLADWWIDYRPQEWTD